MQDELDALQGRVLAQEMLSRIIMTAVANGQGTDPVAVIDRIRRDTLSSLQFAERPIGDREDAIWVAAIEALEREFASVRLRLADQE